MNYSDLITLIQQGDKDIEGVVDQIMVKFKSFGVDIPDNYAADIKEECKVTIADPEKYFQKLRSHNFCDVDDFVLIFIANVAICGATNVMKVQWKSSENTYEDPYHILVWEEEGVTRMVDGSVLNQDGEIYTSTLTYGEYRMQCVPDKSIDKDYLISNYIMLNSYSKFALKYAIWHGLVAVLLHKGVNYPKNEYNTTSKLYGDMYVITSLTTPDAYSYEVDITHPEFGERGNILPFVVQRCFRWLYIAWMDAMKTEGIFVRLKSKFDIVRGADEQMNLCHAAVGKSTKKIRVAMCIGTADHVMTCLLSYDVEDSTISCSIYDPNLRWDLEPFVKYMQPDKNTFAAMKKVVSNVTVNIFDGYDIPEHNYVYQGVCFPIAVSVRNLFATSVLNTTLNERTMVRSISEFMNRLYTVELSFSELIYFTQPELDSEPYRKVWAKMSLASPESVAESKTDQASPPSPVGKGTNPVPPQTEKKAVGRHGIIGLLHHESCIYFTSVKSHELTFRTGSFDLSLSDVICALIDYLSQGDIPERFLPLRELVYGNLFPEGQASDAAGPPAIPEGQASDAAGPPATLREADAHPDIETLKIFFDSHPVEALSPDADFDETLRHGFIMDFLGHLRAYVELFEGGNIESDSDSQPYTGGESKSGVTDYIKRLFM